MSSHHAAGASAFTSRGTLANAGLAISCRKFGRAGISVCLTATGRLLSADRKIASIVRTSARPSRPDGSGSFFQNAIGEIQEFRSELIALRK